MPTLNLGPIAAGADDAHEGQDGANFDATATSIRADSNAFSSANRFVGGLRFANVTIPAGSTIDVAYISITPVNTTNDDANLDIHANDVDDADDFSTEADVTSRVRTTASAAWASDALGTSEVNSPSIVSVIQEIIDRGGWASGNAICILLVGRTDANKRLAFHSEEGTGTAAKLHIEYTEGGGGGFQAAWAANSNQVIA